MYKYPHNIIGLFLIILISGCNVTEENVDKVAAQMQEVYDNINTIQVHKEEVFKHEHDPDNVIEENLREDLERGAYISEGYMIIKFVTDIYIEKPDKEKIEYSRTEGYRGNKVLKLTIGNNMYDEEEDIIFISKCATQIRKEPNFIDYLKGILNKYNLELVGKETISDRKSYKIKLEPNHFIWIDTETLLPLKEVNDLVYELIYSNYKINEDIPDIIFSPPSSNKEIIETDCPSGIAEAEEKGVETIEKDAYEPIDEPEIPKGKKE